MTPEQKVLVQTSFEKIVPIMDQAASLFYARLFELHPPFRALFKSDLTEQGKKLMQTLRFAVASLNNTDALIPAVEALGKKHVGYGVKDSDYTIVGSAFLWTLEKGLGPDFTPEVKEAWTTVYQTLASTMQNAAKAA